MSALRTLLAALLLTAVPSAVGAQETPAGGTITVIDVATPTFPVGTQLVVPADGGPPTFVAVPDVQAAGAALLPGLVDPGCLADAECMLEVIRRAFGDSAPPLLDADGEPLPPCPRPPPPPPSFAYARAAGLPDPQIATNPSPMSFVQIDTGTMDLARPLSVAWVQPRLGGGPNCSPVWYVFAFTASARRWEWHFSTDGHDPHASEATQPVVNAHRLGTYTSATPGQPGCRQRACWSGWHRYRDDTYYDLAVRVWWLATGEGGQQADWPLLGRLEDLAVHEIRSALVAPPPQ